jgi:hypothetical protein
MKRVFVAVIALSLLAGCLPMAGSTPQVPRGQDTVRRHGCPDCRAAAVAFVPMLNETDG